jgi:glycosyltransferase involved in cell wall biosynthesis
MVNIVNKCVNPVLSILICHIEEREKFLRNLLIRLHQQVINEPVEIIIAKHPRGTVTIGEKRNILVKESSGEYLCFIDDDDLISDNYVSLILNAAKTNPDCIGITGLYIEEGKPNWTFRHSITVNRWCKDKDRRIYFRTPNHLNPIKKTIAVKCPFPEIQFGEDRSFSDQVKVFLKTETYIEQPIYYYIFVKDK